MTEPVIEARGLCRSFGERRVLRDLDWSIPRGATTGLLGANGAGKTTFLRLVTGFLLPSAGGLQVDGLSPVREARALAPRLGWVTEQARLYPELRVAGFLRFAGGARGLRGTALRRAVERALERFELGAVARRTLGRCSRGIQRRVSLAQALLHEPPILLVDEPSAGLDPLQRASLHALLAGLAGERTLLLSTHDLEEARALCARVAVLRAGRLVAEGPPGEVLAGGLTTLFGAGGGTEPAPA